MQIGHYWIVIGIISAALSAFSFWYGPHLLNKTETKTSEEKLTGISRNVEELRKLAKEKTTDGLIIINNNGTIGALVNNVETAAVHSQKKEARITLLFKGSALFEVSESHNFAASITDNGLGDVSLIFSEDFSSDDYYINIVGDKSPNYEIIEKNKSGIRIKFDEEKLKWLQIECREN